MKCFTAAVMVFSFYAQHAWSQSFSACTHEPAKGTINLLKIVAEHTPDQCYYLDIKEDSDHRIASVIYRDPFNEDPAFKLGKTYTVSELKDEVVIIQIKDKNNTYDMVKLQLVQTLDQGKSIQIKLKYRAYAPISIYKKAHFEIHYDPHTQTHQVLDLDRDAPEVINVCFAKNRYLGKRTVGILEMTSSVQ